jgi:hypothetical protein
VRGAFKKLPAIMPSASRAVTRLNQLTFWLKYAAPQMTITQIISMNPIARAASMSIPSLPNAFFKRLLLFYAMPGQ